MDQEAEVIGSSVEQANVSVEEGGKGAVGRGIVRACERVIARGPGPPGGRGVCGSASALTVRPQLFKVAVDVYAV